MKGFKEIIEEAGRIGPKRLAVAGRPDERLAAAIDIAAEKGIAETVVFEEAFDAVTAVGKEEADILMKGSTTTKEFMSAVLDREKGLRSPGLVSHIAVLEVTGRLILVTDGGINLNPSLGEKAEILKNALPLARKLGMKRPKVAVLAAVEKVNPDMPETVDAEKISGMDFPDCDVQGPLAVDNAVSLEAAAAKGITGAVAGRADILLVPSVLVGNIFAKGIMYFADSKFGGVVAGTRKPVAFLSRSDTTETKLNTIALGVLVGKED